MGVRLQKSTFRSSHQEEYEINIHDTDHVGGVDASINITELKLINHTSDRDFCDPIQTTSVKITFLMDDANIITFYNDLKGSPEGRFYLEIKQGLTTKFIGRFLVDGISVPEDYKTPLSLEAIDGFTLLKRKDFDYAPANTLRHELYKIFHYCISQIDIIDKFKTDTDKILVMSSNLQSSVTGFTNIFEHVLHQNYFFEEEDNERTVWSCWDVMEELLNRYFLELKYYDGKYYIIGKENYVNGFGLWRAVNKLGSLVTHVENITTVDLYDEANGNYMLRGGVYTSASAVKTIKIETKQNYINYKIGQGLKYLAGEDYAEIGQLLDNDVYIGYTTLNLDIVDPDVFYIRLRVYYKVIDPTATENYLYNTTDQAFNYSPFPITVTQNGSEDYTEIEIVPFLKKFILKITTPNLTGNQELYFKYTVDFLDQNRDPISTDIETFVLNEFDRDSTKNYDKPIVFEYSNDTENYGEKTIEIFGCDQYASSLVKPLITDGSTFQGSGDSWRFNAADSYIALERAIIAELMELMSNPLDIYKGRVEMRDAIVSTVHKVTYKTGTYKITEWELDLGESEATFTAIKIGTATPTLTDGTVLSTPLEPYSEEINISGLISTNAASQRIVETFENVTTDRVTLIYDIPESLYSSYVQSFDVHVGKFTQTKLRQVQTTLTNGTYKVDHSTNQIILFGDMRGENVTVTIYPQFIPATSS